ncbi:MAG: hypothetical protein IIB37_13870 [Gemmatimonadetes bacterium]|nr:hypothetical protein [Gemmatimonadota bacterium]
MGLDQGPEILLWIGSGAFAVGAVGLLVLFVHNYRAPLDVRFHGRSFPVVDVTTVTIPGVGDYPEYVIILPNVMIESYESRPLTLRCELHIQEKDDGSGQVCQRPYHRPSLPDGSLVIGQPVKLGDSGSHERGNLAFLVEQSSFFRDRVTNRPNWERAACHLSLWLIDERSTKARKFEAGYFVGAALPTLQIASDIEASLHPETQAKTPRWKDVLGSTEARQKMVEQLNSIRNDHTNVKLLAFPPASMRVTKWLGAIFESAGWAVNRNKVAQELHQLHFNENEGIEIRGANSHLVESVVTYLGAHLSGVYATVMSLEIKPDHPKFPTSQNKIWITVYREP